MWYQDDWPISGAWSGSDWRRGGWLPNKHQRRCTDAVLRLSPRLRRWPNIKTALVHCLVFAGCPVVGVILSGIHSHPHTLSLSLGGPRDAVCLLVNKMNIKTTTLFTSVVHSPETAINYIIIGGVEHERSCCLSIIIKCLILSLHHLHSPGFYFKTHTKCFLCYKAVLLWNIKAVVHCIHICTQKAPRWLQG